MRSTPGPAAAAGSVRPQSRTRSGQLRLAGLRHPFAWGGKAPVLSTAELAGALAEPFGVATIEPRGSAAAAAHQLSVHRLGPHRLAGWLGTAITLTARRDAPPTLLLLRGGWLEWQSGEGVQPLKPGWLLLSTGGHQLCSGVCAVVAIALERERLALQLRRLCAAPLAADPVLQLLRQPLLLGPGAEGCGALVQAIGCLLDLYERLELQDPRLALRLELDQLLERLVASLLLRASGAAPALEVGEAEGAMACRDAAFEALLARIRAHLAEPIDLATLARWGHCTPRTLQVLFRQRLGCTPIQWLRRERLQLAHRLLEQGEEGERVAAIARRCGYRSASHFSEDFRQRFGCSPAQVLRRGARPGEAP